MSEFSILEGAALKFLESNWTIRKQLPNGNLLINEKYTNTMMDYPIALLRQKLRDGVAEISFATEANNDPNESNTEHRAKIIDLCMPLKENKPTSVARKGTTPQPISQFSKNGLTHVSERLEYIMDAYRYGCTTYGEALKACISQTNKRIGGKKPSMKEVIRWIAMYRQYEKNVYMLAQIELP